MPYINDKYVDFDPDALADAIIQGHTVRPHYYDFEDKNQAADRTTKEYEAISKALYRKNPAAWKKWQEPREVIQHPDFDWQNTPGLMNRINRDNMAMNLSPMNAMSIPKLQPIATNALAFTPVPVPAVRPRS